MDWLPSIIDGSNIRMLKCTAGAQQNIPIALDDGGLGSSSGGFSTKIHMVTNGSGLQLNIYPQDIFSDNALPHILIQAQIDN